MKSTIQSDALQGLSGDSRMVAAAMALLWTWRPRGASYELSRQIGVKSTEGNFGHKETLTLSAGRGE